MMNGISKAALLLMATTALGACTTVERPVTPLAKLSIAPPAAPASAIAPLQYTSRTLANGLQVYGIRDTSTSNASIQVWYDVGSKDDPRARSGFAHLFEHLMFKSTRNLVPEQLDRLTEDVGGFNNASADDDYTNYFETVPANHLERLLWAEAERMGSLVVEPGFFASERDVVKEEYRSRVLAQPYGRLFYLYFPQISFNVHPYGRPGIGSIEDLDAATIDDVRAFHATYYRPDNAVLVVAGNYDPAQLDQWVDRYFAPIERPGTPIPKVTATEPDRTAAKRLTVYEPNTPLPATLLSYPAPRASDPDATVMEVMAAILSAGKSSRLYQSLVYRDQIATEASSNADVKQDGGAFALFAILAAGKSAEAGEAALRSEVARLRDELVTERELAEARNELLTTALRSRETVDGKAGALARAIIVDGDPKAADERLAEIVAVTAADIQRVARKWLTEERSVALRYLPEEMRAGGQAGDIIRTAPTVRTAALNAPANIRVFQPAPEAERVAPPAVGREVSAAVPIPVTQKLANGLTVISVERRDLPLLTATLSVGEGAAADPKGRAGLSSLTASLLTQGTGTRSATEIAQAVEALGGSLQSESSWDGSSLGLTVKSDQADPALAIMADVARNAVFTQEELDRQRSMAIDQVTVRMKNPGAVAGLVAARAVYGEGQYGHPSSGTPASLKAIDRESILMAYRAAWTPANATLILAGDIDAATARALAERHFAGWSTPTSEGTIARTAVQPVQRPDVIVVDMPGSGQAAIAVTRASISRRDPRFYKAAVANAVLGTGFSSRLNQEIRIKRGLAYGAGSSLDARRDQGPFTANTQTKNESAADVLNLVLNEMQRLGSEPIPAAELATRQAVLTGNFGRSIETTSGLAGLVTTYVTRGLPPEEFARYQQSILSVTPAEAQAAAAELLTAKGATIVIVGDASKFVHRLRRQHAKVTVIPLSELRLDTPSLR